jgi:hypothetical protein
MFLYILETNGKDALLMARIGSDDRCNICDMFGFKDPNILVFKKGTATKAKDRLSSTK